MSDPALAALDRLLAALARTIEHAKTSPRLVLALGNASDLTHAMTEMSEALEGLNATVDSLERSAHRRRN